MGWPFVIKKENFEIFNQIKEKLDDRRLIQSFRFFEKQPWVLKLGGHASLSRFQSEINWITEKNSIQASTEDQVDVYFSPAMENEKNTSPYDALFEDFHSLFSRLFFSFSHEFFLLRIPKNVHLRLPWGLHTFCSSDLGDHAFSAQRRLIVLEEGASLCWVESWGSQNIPHKKMGFYQSLTDIYLDKNASMQHYRLFEKEKKDVRFVTARVFQSENSSYQCFDAQAGSYFDSQHTTVRQAGKNSFSDFKGLILGEGSEQNISYSAVEHQVPGGKSDQKLKGILKDQAEIRYASLVDVKPHALGVDAKAYNHHLLLSQSAKVLTKPELAIEADAIFCSHGATVGHVNEDAIFYLKSRGLSDKQALSLLVGSFAQDVLPEDPLDGVLDWIKESVEGMV